MPDERFVDQLGALVAAREEGLIAGVGISNVTQRHLLRALEVTDIVCVQNSYNLANRASDAVLSECTARGIAFVPFCPLGLPKKQHDAIRTHPIVTGIAARHDATPAQVALAWLLAIADNVLLIPGTSSRSHLAENIGAESLSLHDDEVASLGTAFGERDIEPVQPNYGGQHESGALDYRDCLGSCLRRKRADETACAQGASSWRLATAGPRTTARPISVSSDSLEILGAIGLVLPAAVHIAPILVPLAAIGLALVMVGCGRRSRAAQRTNQRSRSTLVLLALAVFVAWGRFGPYSLCIVETLRTRFGADRR